MADTEIKQEGGGSVRISTAWPTTVCLGDMHVPSIENAKLVYQAKVKTDELEGTAFFEMWCHVGGGQYFSRNLDSAVTGTTGWTTMQTPFYLKAGQHAERVTLNIVINGKGAVWVDDVRLSSQVAR